MKQRAPRTRPSGRPRWVFVPGAAQPWGPGQGAHGVVLKAPQPPHSSLQNTPRLAPGLPRLRENAGPGARHPGHFSPLPVGTADLTFKSALSHTQSTPCQELEVVLGILPGITLPEPRMSQTLRPSGKGRGGRGDHMYPAPPSVLMLPESEGHAPTPPPAVGPWHYSSGVLGQPRPIPFL